MSAFQHVSKEPPLPKLEDLHNIPVTHLSLVRAGPMNITILLHVPNRKPVPAVMNATRNVQDLSHFKSIGHTVPAHLDLSAVLEGKEKGCCGHCDCGHRAIRMDQQAQLVYGENDEHRIDVQVTPCMLFAHPITTGLPGITSMPQYHPPPIQLVGPVKQEVLALGPAFTPTPGPVRFGSHPPAMAKPLAISAVGVETSFAHASDELLQHLRSFLASHGQTVESALSSAADLQELAVGRPSPLAVLQMRMSHQSIEDTARHLETSINTVKRRLRKARETALMYLHKGEALDTIASKMSVPATGLLHEMRRMVHLLCGKKSFTGPRRKSSRRKRPK